MNQSTNQPHPTTTIPTSSQKSQHHATIKPPSQNLSTYKSSISQFKQFLTIFQDRLQSVYQKQNYRIYLNDKFHQRVYKQMLKQKDQLHQALQSSKDYKHSANRQLIEEVMNLEKLKEQYEGRNVTFEQKIQAKKKELLEKKKKLKQVQTQIKSYWIYNYDITTAASSVRSSTKFTTKESNSLRYSMNETGDNHVDSQGGCQNKENYFFSISSQYNNTIDITNTSTKQQNKNKQNSIHLPHIPKHNRRGSNLRSSSNHSSNILSQKYQNATTILSKDLSLINCSETREKLFDKIQASSKAQAMEKLQYQKEKLNLLKYFKIYLKKTSEQQQNFTQRMRLEKIVALIEEQISVKQLKLQEIQDLLLK